MMARRLLLILIALLLSAGTAFIANNWLKANRKPVQTAQVTVEAAQADVHILVAKTSIPLGKFVNESDFSWQPWPGKFATDQHLTKEDFKMDNLNGRVSRSNIDAGEPILLNKFVSPGERGFLAAVLKPGQRAVSIGISSDTGVSGLVFPGDRVDLILTQNLQNTEDATDQRKVSETILTNVRVLALGTDLQTEEGQTNANAKTVTLEMNPAQVEIVAVSTNLGRISLSLRPLAKDDEEMQIIIETGSAVTEEETVKGDSYTWDYEASKVLSKGKTPSGGGGLVVSRGNSSVIVGDQ